MLIGNSDRTRVYFWPTDFWGRSYKESEVQNFRAAGTGDDE